MDDRSFGRRLISTRNSYRGRDEVDVRKFRDI